MNVPLLSISSTFGVDPMTLNYDANNPTLNQEYLAIYLLNQFALCEAAGFVLSDGVATDTEVSEVSNYIDTIVDSLQGWIESAVPMGSAAEVPVPIPPSMPDVTSGKGIALIIAQLLAKGGVNLLIRWVESKLKRRQGDSDEVVAKLEEIRQVIETSNDLSVLKDITIDLNDEAGGKIRVYPFAYSVEKRQ